jgi:hypothetical protein
VMATMKEACREEEDAHGPVVHSCPFKGSGDIMPCCGKTPFDIPRWHRLSTKPELVNCDRMKLLAEVERLRGALERIAAEHSPDPADATFYRGKMEFGSCRICSPQDGGWPCVTALEARDALEVAW